MQLFWTSAIKLMGAYHTGIAIIEQPKDRIITLYQTALN
jgi:hypothetical protein